MKTKLEKYEMAKTEVAKLKDEQDTRSLLRVVDSDPDMRARSFMYYHLIRRLFDDDSFSPQEPLEHTNVQKPFAPKGWKLPQAVMFPAYMASGYSIAEYDDSSDSVVINLTAFYEENPIIAIRYACEDVCSTSKIIKGFTKVSDEIVCAKFPQWELYQADLKFTDDMTGVLTVDFGNVFTLEVAHYTPDDSNLHRILITN